MKSKSYAALVSAVAQAGALVCALVCALGVGSAAQAQTADGLALAQQQNCMSCHSVNRPFMGPALHDVAAKYAGHDDAASYLKRKILDGSSGVWGEVPMPANTQLTAEQAATLASWVLTLK